MIVVVLSKWPEIYNNFLEKNKVSHTLIRSGKFIKPEGPWTQGIDPFIFPRNANIALRRFPDDDILLCNDDIEGLTNEGVEHLSTILNLELNIGLVSPKVTGCSCSADQKLVHEPLFFTKSFLPFICTGTKRALIKDIGLFDEDFKDYGGEDVDYCIRAGKKGWRLALTNTVTIHHLGSKSFSKRYGSANMIAQGRKTVEQVMAKHKDVELTWQQQ